MLKDSFPKILNDLNVIRLVKKLHPIKRIVTIVRLFFSLKQDYYPIFHIPIYIDIKTCLKKKFLRVVNVLYQSILDSHYL